MEYAFNTPEDIGRFYHELSLIEIFPGSLKSLNDRGSKIYEPLPNFGLTKTITGVLFPSKDVMIGWVKTIDEAITESLNGTMLNVRKDPDLPWKYLGAVNTIMRNLDAKEDLRIKVKNEGGDTLIYCRKCDNPYNNKIASHLFMYKGVPVRKIK